MEAAEQCLASCTFSPVFFPPCLPFPIFFVGFGGGGRWQPPPSRGLGGGRGLDGLGALTKIRWDGVQQGCGYGEQGKEGQTPALHCPFGLVVGEGGAGNKAPMARLWLAKGSLLNNI